MEELNTQTIIDYTAVPAGWLIKGHLWTGQSTVSTVTCPNCGRVGVISSQEKGRQIIVHSGRVVARETLLGVDYCEIAVNQNNQTENSYPASPQKSGVALGGGQYRKR